jgi:hypothetical protein
LICVNEIADVMAGLGNWLKQRFDKQVPKSWTLTLNKF